MFLDKFEDALKEWVPESCMDLENCYSLKLSITQIAWGIFSDYFIEVQSKADLIESDKQKMIINLYKTIINEYDEFRRVNEANKELLLDKDLCIKTFKTQLSHISQFNFLFI